MINIDKAKSQIDWKPTKLRDAVLKTQKFFEYAAPYSKEFKIAKKKYDKVNRYYPNA